MAGDSAGHWIYQAGRSVSIGRWTRNDSGAAATAAGRRTATDVRAGTTPATVELKLGRQYDIRLSAPPFDIQWAAADHCRRPAPGPRIRWTSACVATAGEMVAADLYSVGAGQTLRSFHGAAHGA